MLDQIIQLYMLHQLHFQLACQYFCLFSIQCVLASYVFSGNRLNIELSQDSTYPHSPKTMLLCRIVSPLFWTRVLVIISVIPLYPQQGILGITRLHVQLTWFISINSSSDSQTLSVLTKFLAVTLVYSSTFNLHDQNFLIAFLLVFNIFHYLYFCSDYIINQLHIVQLIYFVQLSILYPSCSVHSKY